MKPIRKVKLPHRKINKKYNN